MEIRDHCKMLRKVRGLTQKEVADLSGVSLSFYSKFELGQKPHDNITIKTLDKICLILGAKLIMVPWHE